MTKRPTPPTGSAAPAELPLPSTRTKPRPRPAPSPLNLASTNGFDANGCNRGDAPVAGLVTLAPKASPELVEALAAVRATDPGSTEWPAVVQRAAAVCARDAHRSDWYDLARSLADEAGRVGSNDGSKALARHAAAMLATDADAPVTARLAPMRYAARELGRYLADEVTAVSAQGATDAAMALDDGEALERIGPLLVSIGRELRRAGGAS